MNYSFYYNKSSLFIMIQVLDLALLPEAFNSLCCFRKLQNHACNNRFSYYLSFKLFKSNNMPGFMKALQITNCCSGLRRCCLGYKDG